MSNLSRRNFITGGAIAALGGTLAIAGCAPKGESSSTVAGAAGEGAQAWTGTANGKGGELTVEVITEGDSIARINLLKSRESYGVGTAGIDVLSDLIVKNQTLNVDMVTGATVSSMAFLAAVSDAVDASGMKSSEWKKREKAVPQAPEGLTTDVDVVVVGAGGAGYAAALTAAEAGKNVVLLEKLGIVGGDTILSGGAMAVPNNWFQKRDGIEDSVEKMAEDMIVGGDHVGDPTWSTSSAARVRAPWSGSSSTERWHGQPTSASSAATRSSARHPRRQRGKRHHLQAGQARRGSQEPQGCCNTKADELGRTPGRGRD